MLRKIYTVIEEKAGRGIQGVESFSTQKAAKDFIEKAMSFTWMSTGDTRSSPIITSPRYEIIMTEMVDE